MQKLAEKLGLSEGAASATLWVILSAVLMVVVAMLAVWLVRTLRPSLNMSGANRGGRPQRLAITDAFSLDREGRKLVIVRRDNTEHLLLIGGPNDLLVEGNITRHDRALRSVPRHHDGEGEELPAQMALAPATTAAAPASQAALQALLAAATPLAPAARATAPPAPVPQPAPHSMPVPRLVPQPMPQHTAAPPSLLQSMPVPQPMAPAPQPMPIPMPMAPPPAAPHPAPPRAREPFAAAAPVMPALTLEAILAEARPVPGEAKKAEEPPPAPAARPQVMSEMARRLNEALQNPVSGTLHQPFNHHRPIRPAPPAAGAAPGPQAAPLSPPEANRLPESQPVTKADIDLLEEEMARLLGRPAHPNRSEAS